MLGTSMDSECFHGSTTVASDTPSCADNADSAHHRFALHVMLYLMTSVVQARADDAVIVILISNS